MNKLIGIILMLLASVIFGFRISKNIEFKQNVSGYLKRAADANTIALANQELTKVIDYLEANNITDGYTSIFYETPNEDIGFWYQNLKASQNELANLNSESALEKTNVSIKLRETLVDSGQKTRVTIPQGLAVYPNNTMWALLNFLATIMGFLGLIIFIASFNSNQSQNQNS
jgi:hypothetical protein